MHPIKQILFISYDGMTDPLGQSQVIPYLAGLSEHGYTFTILSCEKKERYLEGKEDISATLAKYKIQWEPVIYHKSPPVVSSIYDYFILKGKAAKLVIEKKIEMVHTRPGVPTLVGLWLKKKYGIKFLNDIRGFWADERVDGKMWNLNNPVFKLIYLFFKKHELECIALADRNVCLTHKAKEEILSWNTTPPGTNIEVIPCSVDLRLFDPASIEQSLKSKCKIQLGILEDDVVISYLGSIGGWYLVDEMMIFFKSVEKLLPKAKFLFISPHRHNQILKAACRSGISPSKIISRSAKRTEVPLLLSLSTYSMFFIKKCYSKISSSPTKHGELMAMGIPVITTDGTGDVADIINKYKSGIVLNNVNDMFTVNMKDILSGMLNNSEKIRCGAREYYSLENALATYRRVYKEILG